MKLHKDFKLLRNKVQHKIKKPQANYHTEKVEDHKTDPKKLWQTLKSMGMKNKGTSNLGGVWLKIGENICFDKAIVANNFNKYFTSVHGLKLGERSTTKGRDV